MSIVGEEAAAVDLLESADHRVDLSVDYEALGRLVLLVEKEAGERVLRPEEVEAFQAQARMLAGSRHDVASDIVSRIAEISTVKGA